MGHVANVMAPPDTARSVAARDITLHGRWLVVAWGSWILLVGLAIGLYLAATLLYFQQLHTLCSGANFVCESGQVTAQGLQRLHDAGLTMGTFAALTSAHSATFGLIWCTIGIVIVWRQPHYGMALFVALSLVLFGTTFLAAPTNALTAAYPLMLLPTKLLRYLGNDVCLTLLLFVFPDGRFVPRWARWVAVVAIVSAAPYYFLPTVYEWQHSIGLPLALGLIVLTCQVGAQVYRYRRVSRREQRQQTKWVVFSLVAAIVGVLLIGTVVETVVEPEQVEPLPALLGQVLFTASLLPIPVSIGVAVLRYRLWDIDPIVNRTLVYGTLTASIVGIYVLIVGYLGAVFQTGDNLVISLVATGLLAVLFQPLRERLQRLVNRVMYGERDEPYTVLTRLGQRLEATLAPEAILPTIVATVKEALKLPYVAIAVPAAEPSPPANADASPNAAGRIMAATGTAPTTAQLRWPLVYQHEEVGQLILAARAPGEPFSPADRRLLNDLARQAGVAVHAVRLTTDLQRARERLVTTREEERRRLRRDLHDGLGPHLASQTLTLDAIAKLLTRDPATAATLIAHLKDQAHTALADIRRLVYDLRPPALDDLGLIGALQAQAVQYVHSGLHVTIEAPDRLPPLPAAVEVAIYRIVQEALTNVVRHAQARTCVVRLVLDTAAVVLEITDDGVGVRSDRPAGVGLRAMRERAEELGGNCTLAAQVAGGTRVEARLPLPVADPAA